MASYGKNDDSLWTNDGYYYGVSQNGATRTVVNVRCLMEEVEPGRFIRRCAKIKQMLADCAGRPTEMVTYNQEYTEVKDSLPMESAEPSYMLVLPSEAAQEMIKKDVQRTEAPKQDVSKNAVHMFNAVADV